MGTPDIRTYPARTIRVLAPDAADIDVDLGFGIHVTRRVTIEGVDRQAIPRHLKDNAAHCLVVLLGGKSLYVTLDVGQHVPVVPARVFLNAKVFNLPADALQSEFKGRMLVDAGWFFSTLVLGGFDLDTVKLVLNGKL